MMGCAGDAEKERLRQERHTAPSALQRKESEEEFTGEKKIMQ